MATATPSRLEEGYGMDNTQRETETFQRPTDTTPGNNGPELPAVPSEASREETLGYSNFRRESDIKNAAPKGWPSIAATQMYYNNLNIHRRFALLMQRVLVDQETKLAYLETKLEELDQEDKDKDVPRLNSLRFDPNSLLATFVQAQPQAQLADVQQYPSTSYGNEEQQQNGREYDMWKDKDLLLEAIILRLKRYNEVLQLDKEMQKLPSISEREHRIFYDEIRIHHPLDEPAYQFLYSIDDFVTTVTDRVHPYFGNFVSLMYFPFRKYIKKLVRRAHNNHNEDHPPAIDIDKRLIIAPLKVVAAFLSGALLLSPVAILFLVDLTRVISFVVVVVFMFAFVAVMSWLKTTWYTILVGLCAYMAVLVTFLSNLAQGRD
ncbi:hypothetical protein F5Y06DRAFT_263687 [Hypoxylon sp. FL0890]|nr:hypothetical protein F5Y06DRAFT_263687 [Hypoxylon sp. FL0890]